jgi:hypothetical protein
MEYISSQCSISAQQLRQEIFFPGRSPLGLKVLLHLAFLIAYSLSSPIGLPVSPGTAVFGQSSMPIELKTAIWGTLTPTPCAGLGASRGREIFYDNKPIDFALQEGV